MTALKILIAPTAAETRELRVGLARCGISLMNVEAVTPASLARLIVRTGAGKGAPVEWDRATVRAVVAWLMRDMDWPVNHMLAGSPDVAARLIMALRRRGMTPGRWRAEDRDSMVADLMEAYEACLTEMDATDGPGMVREAIRLAPLFLEKRGPTVIMWLAGTHWEVDEKQLLERLAEDIPVAVEVGGLEPSSPEPDASNAGDIIIGADPVDEATRVIEDMLGSGVPLDQIQIAVARDGRYEAEFEAASIRYGVPVVFLNGRPASATPAGRQVRAILQWIRTGGDQDALRRLVIMGCVPGNQSAMLDLLAAFPMPASLAADVSRVRLLVAAAAKARIPESAVRSLVSFLERHRSVLESGTMTPDALWRHALDICRVDTDVLASAAAGRSLFGLGSTVGMAAPEVAEWLLAFLESSRDTGSEDVPGAVLVVPMAAASSTLRPVTYVMGLDDGAKTPVRSDDLDGLPDRLVAGLERGASGATTTLTDVLAGIRRQSMRVVVTAPQQDLDDGRVLFPHPALIALTGRSELEMKGPRPLLDGLELAGGYHEILKQAENARMARSSASWTAFDGMIDGQEATGPLRGSPSSIERLSECPHRYFLMDVLKVRPVEERTEWFTAAERGGIVHELLRLSLELPGSQEERMASLLEALDDRLEAHTRLSPAPGLFAVQAARQEIRSMVGMVLAIDAAESESFTPFDAEWPFMDVPFGDWVLSGRIDRIDRSPDGSERVVDFKTGRSSSYQASALSKLQRKLQWAIYPVVRQRLEGSTVSRSGYLFLSLKEWGTRVDMQVPTTEELESVLSELAGRVHDGWFPQAAGSDACRYCPVSIACGDLSLRAGELKEKDPEDARYSAHSAGWWWST